MTNATDAETRVQALIDDSLRGDITLVMGRGLRQHARDLQSLLASLATLREDFDTFAEHGNRCGIHDPRPDAMISAGEYFPCTCGLDKAYARHFRAARSGATP